MGKCFYTKSFPHYQQRIEGSVDIVNRLSLLVMVFLIVAVLAAGCTDEDIPVPALPEADAVLPGQVLVTIGNVTGNGIPRGTIDTITFTVGLVPREKSVNLEQYLNYLC